MKKGDLVTVHPAATGVYLIVEENIPEISGITGPNDLVTLYGQCNDDWIIAPMRKKWIEVIQES